MFRQQLSEAFYVASRSASRSTAPPPPRQSIAQVLSALWSSRCPSSSTSQLFGNSSIGAFATKSSAHKYFYAGLSSSDWASSCSSLLFGPVLPAVSISASFTSFVEKGAPPSISSSIPRVQDQESSVEFDVSSSPAAIQNHCPLLQEKRRLLSCLLSCPSWVLSRQMKMISDFSGSSNVRGLPRRTTPCAYHGTPFTRASKETSTRSPGESLRIVRAICRPDSVTVMCASSQSGRPNQKPLSQQLPPL